MLGNLLRVVESNGVSSEVCVRLRATIIILKRKIFQSSCEVVLILLCECNSVASQVSIAQSGERTDRHARAFLANRHWTCGESYACCRRGYQRANHYRPWWRNQIYHHLQAARSGPATGKMYQLVIAHSFDSNNWKKNMHINRVYAEPFTSVWNLLSHKYREVLIGLKGSKSMLTFFSLLSAVRMVPQ